ncbi:hypothetical protein GH5_06383 [Leishmania sp. Ghana 2012 LV757]|uniref:hypothetical protein n=1 Tax=Leishmania sp. Ghana 2012 LV757 TaxID=2803181 RepID=UPI001B59C730|nr:hypothetical protein GH5_06383 [Leishmania sp. Ghana 2012 LV757]
MPLLVQRTYKLGAGSAADAEAPTPSASPLVVPGAPAEHVTTRICHRWSYVDASHHETCIVTLQAHYSLHVDVKGEGSTASLSSQQQTGGHSEGPCSDDGLCGFAWELIWIPSPSSLPDAAGAAARGTSSSGDITDKACVDAQRPARARFFFPRKTSLARSTLEGTGGVLFLSSRHVLVATEASEAAGAAMGPAATSRGSPGSHLGGAADCSLMDSFVLNSGDAACVRAVSPARSWTRVAASASLPCSWAALQAPGRVNVTPAPSSQPLTALLLVAGVALPRHTSATAHGVPLMRLVYVCAAVCSGGRTHMERRAWDVRACVADLCVSGDSADNPTSLQVRLRHAVVLSQLSLCVHRASTEDGTHHATGATGWGHTRCGIDGANRAQSPPLTPQPLDPPDLLWAFIEDTDAHEVPSIDDGQLRGSLVALLPCSRAPARASVAPFSPAAATSSWFSSSAPSPPAVLCMGFRGDTPHGALGVSSAELDSYEKVKQLPLGQTAHSSVQEIVEQLLPSPQRAVYELNVGSPTKPVGPPATVASRGAAAALTVLPAHTALLMLIMDGIHSRNSFCSRAAKQAEASPPALAATTALPQGLYLTDTLPWNALAPLASPKRGKGTADGRDLAVRVHHVPPSGTLWRGLDPLVLSAPAAPTSASRIVCGESGEEGGAMQDMTRAAHRDELAWDVADIGRWLEGLPEAAGGSSDGTYGKDCHAIPMADDSAAEAEGTATPSSPSFMATVTAVASYVPVSSLTSNAPPALRCFPCFNELTHELTMLWCCCNDAEGHRGEDKDQAATERAIALVRPPLSLLPAAASTQEEWEAQVAEWVAGEHVRRHLDSLTTPLSDAAVAAATYRAIRMLLAYAVLHETRPDLPRWPRVLMEVVRSTTAEAAEHHTRLHVYARAVQTFTTARLAASCGDGTAKLEAEVRHMRQAVEIFLRLILRTLVELDGCAGDALGWMSCQWMVRWFLGSGAVASAAGPTRSSPTMTADDSALQEQAAAVEGRALQVLLQLGATAREPERVATAPPSASSPLSILDWLRRALLLFVCRNTQLPLELTIDDIVEASGVLLQPGTTTTTPPPPGVTQVTVTDGWSEASDEETAASTSPPWPARDTAELRDSIEYALLRLVKPEELYRVVHHLANVSAAANLQRSSTSTAAVCAEGLGGRQRLVVRGVLTVADLHALVCAGWASGRPHDAAPPDGFTFVCCVVSVAMAFTSAASPAAADTTAVAEAYERLVIAALDTWGERSGYEGGRYPEEATPAQTAPADATDRVLVYPLLRTPELEGSATAAATTTASTPFPFTLLPPLLTVYLWYHVTHRLCAALHLLPPATSESSATRQPPRTPETDTPGGQPQQPPWLRRAKLRDGHELGALHRGVCVLRCLTQEDAACAEELFAAMRLVYGSPQRDFGPPSARRQGACAGTDRVISTAATTANTASSTWVSQYLTTWHHLLSLEAPPLCSTGALLVYQERYCRASASTAPHIGDAMRVLHLLYASAGNGRVLRAQVLRAMGLQQQVTREVGAAVCTDSYATFACVLQNWRITAQGQHGHSTAKPSVKTTTMRSGGAAATDAIAAWLVQVWANVLLCDSGAVTDVGMYEHLFTALAHAKQRGEQLSSTTAAADVAFALLRPCLLYALPVLEQLAVEEELMSSNGNRSPAAALVYQQYNEPLTWSMSSATPNRAERLHRRRAPELLCAGEVYERVRQQLRRIVALYDVSPSASSGASSTRGADVRFGILAQLMALQPTAANLVASQRRITLRIAKQCAAQHGADVDGKAGRRSASTQSFDAATSGDEESALELRNFFLPPAAAYVAAATAVAMHHATSRTSARMGESSSGFPLKKLPSSAPPLPVGWLVVTCEVLRRELRGYILAELQMNGYVEKPATMHTVEAAVKAASGGTAEDEAPHRLCAPELCWRLVASEARLKAFINALADAVEPLTATLVQAMSFAFIQPLVLLLVLDVLHALLRSRADTHEVHEAADGATQCSAEVEEASALVVVWADASILDLLRQWIRGVAVPLYRHMSDAQKEAVMQIITDTFAREYLTAPRDEGVTAPPGSGAPPSTSYCESDVHVEWRQWRDGASARGVSGKEAAILECLSVCVAASHQQLMSMALPKQKVDEASREAAIAVPQNNLARKATSSSAVTTAAIGSNWLDAGSALRTSLFNTIGAAVAPRAAQQQPQQHARTSSSAISLSLSEAPPALPSPVVVSLTPPDPQRRASRTVVSGDGGGRRTLGLAAADTGGLQLLCKEEAFKRRQCHERVLREQQQFFASPAFQGNLLHLYVALRTEKRRKELMAFALEQHDLLFTLAHREQLLRLDDAREALRRAWCEWGERQRLATRRLLQEERDARMGVEAINYAGWCLLRDAERQERRVWVLYEEGRAGIMALEDDARDGLAVAAARAHLELTKRAAEAEEEAYWKAEEAAWARMRDEEEAERVQKISQFQHRPLPSMEAKPSPPPPSMSSKAQRDGSRTSTSSRAWPFFPANSSSSPSWDRPTAAAAAVHARVAGDDSSAAAPKHIRRGSRKGLGGGAAAVVALHSSHRGAGQHGASDAFTSVPIEQQQQQQQAPPHSTSPEARSTRSEDEENAVPGRSGGLAQGAVQSAISSAGGLFSALSQWQAALRDTVAPPPPTRVSGRAEVRQAGVSDTAAGSTAKHSSVGVAIAKEVSPAAPAFVPDAARSDDWGWSSHSDEEALPAEVKPLQSTAKEDGTRAAMALPLPSRTIAPLRRASPGGETSVAAAATARPPLRKKGFAAAALLCEPVSTASAHAAPQSSPPPLPPCRPLDQHHQQQEHPPSPGDPAMPNPVRSILCAIEAEAAEIISGPTGAPSPVEQRKSAPLRSQPQGLPLLRTVYSGWSASSATRRSVLSPPCESDPLPLTVAAALSIHGGVEVQLEEGKQSVPTAMNAVFDARGAEDVENVGSANEGKDDWGWSDDNNTVEMRVGKPAPAVSPPLPPPAAAAATADEASSPPARFKSSAYAAREHHELGGRSVLAEPSLSPTALTIEAVPLPDARVGKDDWGWSDDDVHVEATREPSPPRPPRIGDGVAASLASVPTVAAHLPNLGDNGVKDGWSCDDNSLGSSIAFTVSDKAPSGAPPAPSGPVAAPTRRPAMLEEFEEMYAAELEVRAQLAELV